MRLFSNSRRREMSIDEDNPYWMSFSDIMAGLLVIFILACAALLLRLAYMEERVSQNIDELKQASKTRAEILKEITMELERQGIRVEISDNDTVLRIPEQAFHFETGRYEVSSEHQDAAYSIGQALYAAITKEQRWRYLDTVFVEGHTDSRTARNYRMGNWELSALRAIALWKYWTQETPYGTSLEELRNRDGKPLFSVSGYSATRRVAEQEDTEEAMRKNRRIDIRFTTRQPTIIELKRVSTPLRGEQ